MTYCLAHHIKVIVALSKDGMKPADLAAEERFCALEVEWCVERHAHAGFDL